MKPRHHLYLDDELSAQLDALASVPGTTKSAIVSDALRQYLKHRATSGADDALRSRLDRLSAQQDKTRQDLAVVIETLVHFAHRYYQMTAHLPEPDNAATAKAREKMMLFISAVGRGLSVEAPSQIARAIEDAKRTNETGAT
jgi:predicted transcriptional regulator